MSTQTPAATTGTAPTTLRTVGTIGLIATVLSVVGNALHPFDGSTELYADIALFAAKAEGPVWVIDHLVIAVVLLVVPWLLHTWAQTLPDPAARTWGRLAVVTATIGTAIGTVHLAGIDGAALGSYAEVLASSPSEAATAAGAVLLRVHLATFLSWVVSFWAVTQLLLAVVVHKGDDRPWLTVLLAAGGLLAAASAVITASEGQLTTLSEPILFRPSTITFTVWLFVASFDLRRAGEPATA